ncbi:MAG: MotA/TolQ/ExbB proton channel family protein, partial [Planctomycetota bacterium]
RTASGRLEAVELLQVGHAAFAYRVTADPSRVAVARPAPDNAGGFRWRETTGAAIGEPLRAAFDALVRRDASITVPLDVSGRAQPDSDLANGDGWLGFWSAGGPVMVPLGLVALLALVLIVERCVALFVLNRGSDLLARRVLDDCRAGRFDEALRAADSRRNVSARVLASALRRRGSGSQAVEDSIQEALLHEVPRVGRFLGGLAVLAAIAPLLGLLGTVTGIIETFHVIRQFGNADPGLMAGGISQALITTATGLSIAIPILVVHSLLRARGDRVLSQAETSAAAVLNLLNWDAPSSPSSTPTPPPTPTPEAAP